MKSLKRSIVFFMVFAMVLTSVAPVFAATPSDVVGTAYEGAVGKLVALGVVAGYEDGTFKPEQNITRAEFAKIACYVVGLQSAAELSKGATKFKDVAADHWAAGYINIASEKGMIKGYPDKSFKPSENVSYAEAITILVRALGMGPVVEGKGTWPANYLSKASEAGITDDVAGVVGNGKALRGVIGQLAFNTLEAEKWGEKEYTASGIVYGPLGKTLLQEKYSDFVYKDSDGKFVPKIFEDAEIVKTQLVGGLGEDEVQIKFAAIATKLNITATSDTPRIVNTDNIIVEAEGLESYGLLGKKVDVMFGKDNKLVNFQVKSTVAPTGLVEEFKLADNKIKVNGTDYTLATAASIYVNTSSAYTTLTAASTVIGSSKAKATIILNSDGKVSTLDLFVADTNATLKTKQFIVKEVKTNGDVYALDTDARPSNDSKNFNLSDITGVNTTQKAIIEKNGKKATKDDIKAGDIVTWISVNADLNYVVVSDNKVTGTVSVISPDSSSTYKMTVGTTEYAMAKDGSVRMTKNAKVDEDIALDNSITDFQGKEVTVSLNAIGQIVFINANVVASANEQYGILTKDIWESTTPDANGKLNKFMEVRTTAGEKKVFTLKGDKYKTATTSVPTSATTEWDMTGSNPMKAGTLVQYKIDADGTVNAANLVRVAKIEATLFTPNVTDLATKTDSIYVASLTASNSDAKSITQGGVTYYYSDTDTTIFNANTTSNIVSGVEQNKLLEKVDGWDAVRISGAGALADKLTGAPCYIVYNKDTKIIKTLVIDITSYLTSTNKYGAITQTQFSGLDTDGSAVWKIKVYTDGVENTYTVSQGVYDSTVTSSTYAVKVGDFVKFTLDSDGKFDGATGVTGPTAQDVINAKEANVIVHKQKMLDNVDGIYDNKVVKEVVGSLIVFNEKNGVAPQPISVKSDAKVYDISGATPTLSSISAITAGCMVVGTEQDLNGQYKVIVIVNK